MQLAAFLICVISAICGRITRKRTLSILHKGTPMSPADLADDADEPQNDKTTITAITTRTPTCLYLRDNAACCIPLRNQRYLRENNHMRVLKLYCTNETPMSPADLADDADEPQNPKLQ